MEGASASQRYGRLHTPGDEKSKVTKIVLIVAGSVREYSCGTGNYVEICGAKELGQASHQVVQVLDRGNKNGFVDS